MSIIKIDYNPPAKTLRNFGFIGIVAFPLLALAAYYRVAAFALLPDAAATAIVWTLLILALYCAAGALLAPAALRPLFVGMTVIGAPIGIAISYLLLGIIFYGVVTPVAIVFKIMGRDAMTRRFDPAAATYWIRREPTKDLKRYFRQF